MASATKKQKFSAILPTFSSNEHYLEGNSKTSKGGSDLPKLQQALLYVWYQKKLVLYPSSTNMYKSYQKDLFIPDSDRY